MPGAGPLENDLKDRRRRGGFQVPVAISSVALLIISVYLYTMANNTTWQIIHLLSVLANLCLSVAGFLSIMYIAILRNANTFIASAGPTISAFAIVSLSAALNCLHRLIIMT